MRKIRQVNNNVATVIPEIGFEEEPISPVSRDETVTKIKPNTTISSAPNKFMCSEGASVTAAIRTTMPMPTNFIDRSRSVRGTNSAAAPATRPIPMSRKPPLSPCQIVGSDWIKLKIPPAATAPAPM